MLRFGFATRRLLSTRAAGPIARTTTKKKVGFVVGYRGTDFAGSLRNPQHEQSTIEEEIESALYACDLVAECNRSNPKKMNIARSSRTDKGVHSACSMLAMKLDLPRASWAQFSDDVQPDARRAAETQLLHEQVVRPVNQVLHPDVRLLKAFRLPRGFDPRSFCSRRCYEYVLPLQLLADTGRSVRVDSLDERLRCFTGPAKFHNFTKQRNLSLLGSTAQQTHHRQPDNDSDDDADEEEEDEDGDTSASGKKRWKSISFDFDYRQDWAQLGAVAKERWRLLGKLATLNRIVTSCRCSETVVDGEPCLVFSVQGKSFLYHQIRKMVGVALAEELGYVQPGYAELALRSSLPFPTPLVPGMFLLLADSEWSLNRDEFISFPRESERYRSEQLYPHLLQLAKQPAVKDEWRHFFTVLDRMHALDQGLDHSALMQLTRRPTATQL